jgi:hypothetical protein
VIGWVRRQTTMPGANHVITDVPQERLTPAKEYDSKFGEAEAGELCLQRAGSPSHLVWSGAGAGVVFHHVALIVFVAAEKSSTLMISERSESNGARLRKNNRFTSKFCDLGRKLSFFARALFLNVEKISFSIHHKTGEALDRGPEPIRILHMPLSSILSAF